MKTYLLPENGCFYKANLHCHSTFSDGQMTPAELKEEYKKRGYSIVAYTDHNVLLAHDELADDGFLPLHGLEVDVTEPGARRCCHLCFIALEPDNLVQPCWHRTAYLFCNAVNYRDQVQFDESLPDFERTYDSDCINRMIKTAADSGFFVTYNHPTWSREHYPDYIAYTGMHAMEMFNGGTMVTGYEDYNPRVYDDFLRAGRRLYCIGADDNHNWAQKDSRQWDSGVAFTVIKADSLDYRTVTRALEAGHFYASEGPEIHALWVEDGRVHIRCSAADRVYCTYDIRRGEIVCAQGEPVTEASFAIAPEYGYFRLTVVDETGKHACTNAYYPAEYL